MSRNDSPKIDGVPSEVEYVPRFDKQLQVITASPGVRTLFIGGVGYGKTLVLGDFVQEEMCNYPNNQMTVAGASIPAMETATIPKLLENFKARSIWFDYVPYKNRVYFANGSWLKFQSLEVPEKELEGSELGALAIDEVSSCAQKKVEALLHRVRRQSPVATKYRIQRKIYGDGKVPEDTVKPGDDGWWDYSRRVLMCGNPPEPGHWLEKEFIEPPDGGSVLGPFIQASTYDNWLLTEDYIANLEKQHPPGTQAHERMMLGKFGVPMEGAVYAEYNPKIHIVGPDGVPFGTGDGDTEHVVLWRNGLDLGHSTKDAFVYLTAAVTNRNNIYIVGEYYCKEPRILKQHAASIRAIHRGGTIWSDYGGQERMELAALGIKTHPANKDLLMGIHATRQRLSDHKLFFVRGRCPNLLREISAYEWGPDDKPLKGKEGDHALDALRYIVASIDLPRNRD